MIMATLSHLPHFHSLSSNKKFSAPLPSLKLSFSPCQNHPRISASVKRKPRASRRVKSNEDLYNDIKEFLSIVGLPQDHVPSMKELSQHGRQDLANIVRRRGYKFIRELLTTSAETQINGSSTEENLTREQDILGDRVGMSTSQHRIVKEPADATSLSSQISEVKEHEKSLVEDASISIEASKGEVDVTEFAEDVSFSLGAAGANLLEDNNPSTETNRKLDSDEHICRDPESSIYPSLEEKVTKFVQVGELDDVEENGFEILNGRTLEESREITDSQNYIEPKSATTPEVQNDLVLYGAGIFNGNIESSSQQVEHPLLEINSSRTQSHSTEEATMTDHNEDPKTEAQKVENQTEINRLKFMLHQKELELTELKKQIEKEKFDLSILQTKADEEITTAQKLILEKDAELQAAEENLSGLMEVAIEYRGAGEVVEVAGSFNGWHQQIKMDPQPSSSISDPIGSWKSRLWRAVLWLYPGVYEIKFIVDGQWTVDSQRESVTRGTIHNNILRVVR